MRITKNFKDNCINNTCTVMDALGRLEHVYPKVLFVLNDDDSLQSSVTDGDIRRAILSGFSVDTKVECFAKKMPVCLTEEDGDDIKTKALEIMHKYGISAVPLIDDSKKILSVVVADDRAERRNGSISLPVVMMAGGKGTRLYPYTKILPKPLIPIEEIPISERIMDSLHGEGCNDFYLIVNYKKDMIKSYFDEGKRDYNISFYDEKIPLGTGGGLKLIENDIKDTFIMTNCDILILDDASAIVRHHKESGNKATMVCSLKHYEVPYGVVNFSEGGLLESLEEKPKMSFFTNTGYYILEKEVFDYIKDGEAIGMPDIILRMKEAGLKVGVYPIGEDTWLDMGQFDSMETMERRIRNLDIN